MPRSRLRRTTGAEGLHTHAAEAVVAEIQAAGGRAVASLDSVAKSASAGRIVQAALALDMARYRVRSNCIAPWARTASVPAETPEAKARMEKLKTMEPRKIAPLAVYLASDAGAEVSGQIFGVRANEIYLFSQPRVIRSVHRSNGWTPESIAEHAMPAMRNAFSENVASPTLTTWDPI